MRTQKWDIFSILFPCVKSEFSSNQDMQRFIFSSLTPQIVCSKFVNFLSEQRFFSLIVALIIFQQNQGHRMSRLTLGRQCTFNLMSTSSVKGESHDAKGDHMMLNTKQNAFFFFLPNMCETLKIWAADLTKVKNFAEFINIELLHIWTNFCNLNVKGIMRIYKTKTIHKEMFLLFYLFNPAT